jgi:hypothetical protein
MIARYIPRQVDRLDIALLSIVGIIGAAAGCGALFFVTREPFWIVASAIVPAMIGTFVALCYPPSRSAGETPAARRAHAEGRALAQRIDLDRPLPPTPDKTSEE